MTNWQQPDPTEPGSAIGSPFLVGPIAVLLLALAVVGFSAPYKRFDVTEKIQMSLVHKPAGKTLRASY